MSMIAKKTTDPKLTRTFPNLLSEFVYKRTYAKWNGARRENWSETVDRYVEFLKEECPNPKSDGVHANYGFDASLVECWSARKTR